MGPILNHANHVETFPLKLRNIDTGQRASNPEKNKLTNEPMQPQEKTYVTCNPIQVTAPVDMALTALQKKNFHPPAAEKQSLSNVMATGHGSESWAAWLHYQCHAWFYPHCHWPILDGYKLPIALEPKFSEKGWEVESSPFPAPGRQKSVVALPPQADWETPPIAPWLKHSKKVVHIFNDFFVYAATLVIIIYIYFFLLLPYWWFIWWLQLIWGPVLPPLP